MSPAVATFGAVFAALYAAHQVADHWIQTEHQSDTKGKPGWAGRISCLAHVATYTLTAVAALGGLVWQLGMVLDLPATVAGLTVSAITHYVADRREPLRRIAKLARHSGFFAIRDAGINGAYLMDQSWHTGWLFIAALIIAGGAI